MLRCHGKALGDSEAEAVAGGLAATRGPEKGGSSPGGVNGTRGGVSWRFASLSCKLRDLAERVDSITSGGAVRTTVSAAYTSPLGGGGVVSASWTSLRRLMLRAMQHAAARSAPRTGRRGRL